MLASGIYNGKWKTCGNAVTFCFEQPATRLQRKSHMELNITFGISHIAQLSFVFFFNGEESFVQLDIFEFSVVLIILNCFWMLS